MLPASDGLSGSPERVRHASSEFGAKLIMARTNCEIKIEKGNVANVNKSRTFPNLCQNDKQIRVS